MVVFQGTAIQCADLSRILNLAYGFPSRGTQKQGQLPAFVPATWNGSGATPAGWTKKRLPTFGATALDARVEYSDADRDLIAASPSVTAPDKVTAAAFALPFAAGTGRIDVPDITDGNTRTET